jgi:hypothetical protein
MRKISGSSGEWILTLLESSGGTSPHKADVRDIAWLERLPIRQLWVMFFALHFGAGAFNIRPRPFEWGGAAYSISGWVANLELAVRWASVWTLVLVTSRAVAVRLPSRGWRVCVWALLSGLGLSCMAVGLLNLVPCVAVPWSVCVINRNWFGVRLMAVGEWTFITVPLILAWLLARAAVLHRADNIRADQLRGVLSRFQSAALTSQVRPHFLFNALQSVATLMHRDVEAADRMLMGIRKLLQRTIDLEGNLEVTLRTELTLLQQYTDIEKVRFGSRLEVSVEIDDRAYEAKVPQLILQPLVENSIHHAFTRTSTGRVGIKAWVDLRSEALMIEVRDNGSGAPTGDEGQHFGLGLRTLRARLSGLYGERQSVALLERPGGGTTARIQLPYVPIQ